MLSSTQQNSSLNRKTISSSHIIVEAVRNFNHSETGSSVWDFSGDCPLSRGIPSPPCWWQWFARRFSKSHFCRMRTKRLGESRADLRRLIRSIQELRAFGTVVGLDVSDRETGDWIWEDGDKDVGIVTSKWHKVLLLLVHQTGGIALELHHSGKYLPYGY